MSFPAIFAFLVARVPDLRAQVRGATSGDIERLAELSPRPLPRAYVEFLRAMGGSTGSFSALPVADCRAAELWPHLLSTPPSYPTDRFLKVGIDLGIGRDIREDWFLDLQRGDPDDPPVVSFEDEGDPDAFREARAHVVARSWTGMLQRHAFLFAAAGRRSFRREEVFDPVDPRRIDAAAAICARLGLTPVMPSQPGLHTLERADLSVMLEVPPDMERLEIEVGADSPRAVQLFLEVMRDNLDDVAAGGA
ncbi:SMI1/KNR4 family protein [Nannocystis bainbridge]|uniref:SMI1/KNR4 family protein n=1 Tax=Nannocystis bainbridge TaxID=2995303 RepID=A0ABT5E6L2_9BACT|nr:SMI1/KNR4 family protein [Nannocystis bainbridge]MDC0721495.1 SMI1/KNR4 family protein [Nannocystis bainbridge]